LGVPSTAHLAGVVGCLLGVLGHFTTAEAPKARPGASLAAGQGLTMVYTVYPESGYWKMMENRENDYKPMDPEVPYPYRIFRQTHMDLDLG